MNFQNFCKKVTDREGKKVSVNIAQVSEVVGIIADMIHENPEEVIELLKEQGAKRAGKKGKKFPGQNLSINLSE